MMQNCTCRNKTSSTIARTTTTMTNRSITMIRIRTKVPWYCLDRIIPRYQTNASFAWRRISPMTLSFGAAAMPIVSMPSIGVAWSSIWSAYTKRPDAHHARAVDGTLRTWLSHEDGGTRTSCSNWRVGQDCMCDRCYTYACRIYVMQAVFNIFRADMQAMTKKNAWMIPLHSTYNNNYVSFANGVETKHRFQHRRTQYFL